MSRNSHFRNLSLGVILVFFVLSASILTSAVFLGAVFFKIIFVCTAFLLFIVLALLLAGFFTVNTSLVNDRKIDKKNNGAFTRFFMNVALRVYMPFLLFVSDVFSYRKDEIRKVFIKANNKYVLSLDKKVLPEKLLVILPHCLQWSECAHRIREGLNECRQCCRCTLGKIKDLVRKFRVNIAIATGGTSARKAIKDFKPDLVVAVACERDLASGFIDVKKIPVYGIINKRPHGPCRDTWVNTEELEWALKHFLQKQE
ncbi:hypothetical protein CSTERLE_06400 [Thermoclostridium stercorarium subsp. leptospartum DSM 9219]|uniref:DUF116 domain-containing protein n=1 Tax=Thermoclostridium stercorarium subsp. leptospartum DSM 9219 TaxID=1346611 RepID=A0A1B1YKE2_THEST|nr:DUF116 domain-containing protein [Thermoclostridium stercorarium]ANX01223.1 hypothetical protein CSTERLE_06400 [Thermoclostridium stercorarium subsp. leptospartum DSM 9219]